MTIAEAVHALAVAGCRLAPGPDGGMTVVVPEGTTVQREALEVLRAHRDQLSGLVPAKPRAADLAEYLAEKKIVGSTAELVLHAARTFNVPIDRITIEGDPPAEAAPVTFEPGIPAITTANAFPATKEGSAQQPLPAGALGLLVPQLWAIHDAAHRAEVEAIREAIRLQGRPVHVPLWMNGRVHLVDHRTITVEGAVAPDGMNLLPWRPLTPEERRP